jgi:hypothetical protein
MTKVKDVIESTLSQSQRDSLSKSDFGLPDTRSYPMPDENHVRSAISMFNRSNEKDRHKLAQAIQRKIKKFGMNIDLKNNKTISKYL